MIHAVLVSDRDLEPELGGTLLFRRTVERLPARTVEDVFRATQGGRGSVVIIDSALPDAASIAVALRRDPLTRAMSIAALGRGELGLALISLLEAGVNAILPLPPGADWDDRLTRLVHIPARKVIRFPVNFAVGGGGAGREPFAGRAVNLSVHGLLLESGFPLGVGEDVQLSFDLPRPFGEVRGTGTVVRLAAPTCFGIEITSVEGDGRVRIKRFVETPRPD